MEKLFFGDSFGNYVPAPRSTVSKFKLASQSAINLIIVVDRYRRTAVHNSNQPLRGNLFICMQLIITRESIRVYSI